MFSKLINSTFILNVLLLIMVFVTKSILSKVKGENTKQTSGQRSLHICCKDCKYFNSVYVCSDHTHLILQMKTNLSRSSAHVPLLHSPQKVSQVITYYTEMWILVTASPHPRWHRNFFPSAVPGMSGCLPYFTAWRTPACPHHSSCSCEVFLEIHMVYF